MCEYKTWEELTEAEQLQSEYSDLYKDVNGFRPRFTPRECLDSVEWLKNELDRLYEELKEVMARDDANEKLAITEFEAFVERTIEMGASDRKTALDWIMSGSGCNGDWEFLCYEYNLPYHYFK